MIFVDIYFKRVTEARRRIETSVEGSGVVKGIEEGKLKLLVH